MISFAAPVQKGLLPSEQSFLTLKGDAHFALSLFDVQQSKGQNGKEYAEYIVRLYDVSGQGGKGEIITLFEVKSCVYTDLKGDTLSEAEFEGKTIYFEAKPNKIISLKISFQ